MRTRDETGLGEGNRTKICFFDFFKIFSKLFEISGELFAFFGAKYFSNRNFSGGVGQGSVRAVQKHAYFRFSGHMAFCQAGFWAALDFGQPGTTVHNPSQNAATLKSGGRFSYIITCALALVGENNQR